MWERLSQIVRESRRYEQVSKADQWLVCLDARPVARIANPQDADMCWYPWEISSCGDAPVPHDLWAYENDARRSFQHVFTKERTEAIPAGDSPLPDGRVLIRSLYRSRFSLRHFLAALLASRRNLKYVPAVLLGLLAVGWVVSVWLPCGFSIRTADHKSRYTFNLKWGNVRLFYDEAMVEEAIHNFYAFRLWRPGKPEWAPHNKYLGKFEYEKIAPMLGLPTKHSGCLSVPIIALLSASLPFAIGPILSFRFRLWHYLAYTALVAVELAYYLQWQA